MKPKVLYKLGLSYYANEEYKKCTVSLKNALKQEEQPYFSY